MTVTSPLTRTTALLVCILGSSSALAAVAPDFVQKLTSESRPLEDRVRDGARRPYQVMQLLGVDAGMTLLDVGAGGGWFTRVLSAATGPSGKVIAQFGPRALQRDNGQAQKDLAASLGNTEAFFGNLGELPATTSTAR
jgi:predicted methyltransferase